MNQVQPWLSVFVVHFFLFACAACPLFATPCYVTGNGTGTITLPPLGCEYWSQDDVYRIIDGLPPASTIELDGPLWQSACDGAAGVCGLGLGPGECEAPGGTLAGDGHCFSAVLELDLAGTGALAGYSRSLSLPVEAEAHTGPRTPGDPVQAFATDMFRLQGEIVGDPDFDLLRFTFGTDFGLPSPGQTTLYLLGSEVYFVDSFFDISYQIDFVGATGSALDGFAGTTTGSIRIQTVEPTYCDAQASGVGCVSAVCPFSPDSCKPSCANLDPLSGTAYHTECDCRAPSDWGVNVDFGSVANICVAPDNGTETITLPPQGCEYLSPEDVYMIIDGLPVGSTIELDGPFGQFVCDGAAGVCSLGLGPGECEVPGGTLAGDGHCFSALLDLDLTGTGDLAGFSRSLSLPVEAETHTGPRTPGDPVQAFAADMFRLQGEIVGDPDFDLLRITSGTDLAMPSPGQTTLYQLQSGDFVVDSFFDISYQIDFVGAPGSPLEGLAGTTMATIRITTGTIPSCSGSCPPPLTCTTAPEAQPDFTIDFCCEMTLVNPLVFADGFESGNTTAWSATSP